MRERVRTGFETIKANMSAMITVAPRRSLNLQDEIDAVQAADYDPEVTSVTPNSEAEFLAAQEHVQETAANAWARVPEVAESHQSGEELSLF